MFIIRVWTHACKWQLFIASPIFENKNHFPWIYSTDAWVHQYKQIRLLNMFEYLLFHIIVDNLRKLASWIRWSTNPFPRNSLKDVAESRTHKTHVPLNIILNPLNKKKRSINNNKIKKVAKTTQTKTRLSQTTISE